MPYYNKSKSAHIQPFVLPWALRCVGSESRGGLGPRSKLLAVLVNIKLAQCRSKASFALTLFTEAVQSEVVSTHIPTNRKHSRHVVVRNERQPLSLLLFCTWDRIKALMLIYTTNSRALCMSSSER